MPNEKSERPQSAFALDIEASGGLNFVRWQSEKALKLASAKNEQNEFSFLRRISITNNTPADLRDGSLELAFSPDIVHCDPLPFVALLSGTTTDFLSFNCQVDPKALYELSETVNGSLTVRLLDHEGKCIATTSVDLPFQVIEESASAFEDDPRVLAAFVTPNDDQVLALANKAAAIRESKYGRSDFDGYQANDVNEVKEQLDCLYLALQAEGIHYSNPPASFNKTFQRVRLPYEVLLQKTATCLDFSLLFASLCEAVGLEPLLILVEGHAFNGCYLEESKVGPAIIHNSTHLSNDASEAISKLCLLNTTCAQAGGGVNFEAAIQSGVKDLSEKTFSFALDIHECRESLIRPIPTPHQIDGKTTIDYEVPANDKYILKKLNPDRSLIEESHGKIDKFDIWERKLLDLDLRNNLIKMRLSGTCLQAFIADPKVLVSAIEKYDKLLLCPANLQGVSDRSYLVSDNYATLHALGVNDGCSEGRLTLINPTSPSDKALIALARKANTEMEESGCNSLFLTIGALKWYATEREAQKGINENYAPLLLSPLTMPRRKAGEYYAASLESDLLQVNLTLFEYLKQFLDVDLTSLSSAFAGNKDFASLLTKVFNTIRAGIAGKTNWELKENLCCLSTFSFDHFVMWSDLKRYKAHFLANPISRSFVDGRQEWEEPAGLVKANQLDQALDPGVLALPLSADSSQIEAIVAALHGESFVLDGPPGTGKSQTIANLIVNFLYSGKTILFVAEKEVALEVVKKRLDDIGLGHFCLQVHSAKANKKDVLAELGETLEIGQTASQGDYAAQAAQLKEQRDALNQTLAALHGPGHYFMPLYRALVHYLKYETYQGRIVIDDAYAKACTAEQFEKAQEQLASLRDYGLALGGYHLNPFLPFQDRDYDMAKRDALFTEIGPFLTALNDLNKANAALFPTRFPCLLTTPENLKTFDVILTSLRKNSDLEWAQLSNDSYYDKKEAVLAYLSSCLLLATSKEALGVSFTKDVFSLDAIRLEKRYEDSAKLSFFARFRERAKLQQELKRCASDKKAVSYREVGPLLAKLAAVQSLQISLTSADPYAILLYHGALEQSATECQKTLLRSTATYDIAEKIRSLVLRDGCELPALFLCFRYYHENPEALYGNEANAFLSAYEKMALLAASLKERYHFDAAIYPQTDDYYQSLSASLALARQSKGRLGEWCHFLSALDQAAANVPASLLLAYRSGSVREEELLPVYKSALYYRIVVGGLSEEKLGSLTALETEQEIAKYKTCLDKLNALSIQETAERVSSRFPSNAISYAEASPISGLRHLCANGGRGRSLRSIFDTYGSLIRQLCPCFLMSPSSLAQFLSPESPSFDAVVFDEASQIPTSEAIGAIERANCAIIAGDLEQMPPTNFFEKSLAEEGEEAEKDDLESLLDDAISLHFPRYYLNWHYRSHHESLIAFSNSRFYQNKLYTFPSPTNQDSRVSFHFVKGHYENNTNKEEAKAIVAEVVRRVKDPELSKRSIGIITFNEKQQGLVEDLLQSALYSHPELVSAPGGEEIFVKNLENVQGDERDVILFSICFAPAKEGAALSLNFGPLSREKGERRLNVAVSRSRDEMLVYASIHAEDIAAERASNDGARYLRAFLSYAEHGYSSLSQIAGNVCYSPSLSISSFLAEKLREKGYQVDTDVGTSSFRVDLGVKSPLNPKEYCLGILCDSHSYSDSPSCEDRNVIQPLMLSKLHWRLTRVWSVEFFDHPLEVIRRLENQIALSLKEPKAEEKAKATAPIEFVKKEQKTSDVYPHLKPYPSTDYTGQASFQRELIKKVVEREYPIARSQIEKRFREVYGIGRIGAKLSEVIDEALSGLYSEKIGDYVFYFPSPEQVDTFDSYRPESPRAMFEVAPEEIANALAEVIAAQGPLPSEDAIKAISTLFGVSSLKEKSHSYLLLAFSLICREKLHGLTQAEGKIEIRE